MFEVNKVFKKAVVSSVVSTFLLGLSACGGGSGSDSTGGDNGWVAGVFQSESNFKSLCENPRTGNDPYNNNQPYPDQQGSLLNENNWLRSWSNNTYLWYDEIVDRNPANYSSTIDYFETLKTNATTSSGNPKDNFHFTYDTAEYNQLAQSGVSAGYGVEWKIISPTVPRKIVVAFSEPNTPAATENLSRGAEILEIDGVDINTQTQSGVDTLNAGLFPSALGESHTFKVLDLGSNQERTITLTAEEIASEPVLQVTAMDTNAGKVGYVVFNTFGTLIAEESLVNAFSQLENENVDELVLDLRYNGGGYLAIASQLSYMIAGSANTSGRTFNRQIFNDKHPNNNPVTGQAIQPTPFYNTTIGFSVPEGQSLPTLNLSRVYILSTDGTCSASESVINALRGIDIEVVLVGGTTCGKPYGFYATDNCGTTYFTIQMQASNHVGFGDYADGFSPANTAGTVGVVVPGCSVEDDLEHALGELNEGLLSAALEHIETGSCPTPTGKAVKSMMNKSNADGLSLFDSEIFRRYEFIRQNKFFHKVSSTH